MTPRQRAASCGPNSPAQRQLRYRAMARLLELLARTTPSAPTASEARGHAAWLRAQVRKGQP